MIKSKNLSKIKSLKHGFFNSVGGHSKDIYKSLNCGPGSGDKKLKIKKNLQKVRKKISTKAKNILLVRQFHSNKFIYIYEKYKKKKKPKADAIITNQKYLPIAVLTADCAPILIYDDKIDKKIVKSIFSELKLSGCKIFSLQIKGDKFNKNEKFLFKILDYLIQNKFTKKSVILSCGGGVVGDVAALASS